MYYEFIIQLVLFVILAQALPPKLRSDIPNEVSCRNVTSGGVRGFCALRDCCDGSRDNQDFREGLCPNQEPKDVVCCLSKDVCAERINGCKTLKIVPRYEWWASPPKWGYDALPRPVKFVIIHSTESDLCHDVSSCSARVRQVQNKNFNEGAPDIKYSFVIGQDASVFVGRDWYQSSGHGDNYDRSAISVTFLGNYNFQLPNANVLETLNNLLECGIEKGNLSRDFTLHGHRDADCIRCPAVPIYAYIKTLKRYNGELPNKVCGDPNS